MNKQVKAHLGLLGANIFYGAGFSVAKLIMPSLIQPRAFILIRVVVTCLLFWLTYYLINHSLESSRLTQRNRILVILGGVFGVALNQLLFFEGLSLTTPIHASLIMLSTPIIVTFLSSLWFRQKIGLNKIIGLLLGVIGAIVLIQSRHSSVVSPHDIIKGDIFILLNAVSYAIYIVIIKPVMNTQSSLKVITYVFTVGALIVIPVGLHDFNQIRWSDFDQTAWTALWFIVLAVTYCTYLWNAYGIKVLSPVVAGAYIYTQPVFAAIISVWFYHEPITIYKLIAAMFIFSGVYLVTKRT